MVPSIFCCREKIAQFRLIVAQTFSPEPKKRKRFPDGSEKNKIFHIKAKKDTNLCKSQLKSLDIRVKLLIKSTNTPKEKSSSIYDEITLDAV